MKFTTIKRLLVAIMLTLPISMSFADAGLQKLDAKANWNRLEVHNHMDFTIEYRFGSGANYSIRPQKFDSYHSKFGDSSTHFYASRCTREATGIYCSYSTDIVICSPYTYCAEIAEICNISHLKYNADLIKRVDINAINQCVVTCLDGSNTSCLATK